MSAQKTHKTQNGKAVSSGEIFPKIIWEAQSGQIWGVRWDPENSQIWENEGFGLKAENRLFWPQNREIRVILGGPKIGPETPKSGFPYRPLMAGTRGEMPTGGPGPYLVGTPES